MPDIYSISNFKFLRLVPSLLANPLRTLSEKAKPELPILSYSLGKFRMLYVNDAEILKHILVTNQNSYDRRTAIKAVTPLLGNGLFSSDEEYWEKQQRMIQPAFHIKNYDTLIPVIISSLDEFYKRIDTLITNNEAIDIQYHAKLLLLDILLKNFFSPDLEYDGNKILQTLDELIVDSSIQNQILRETTEYWLKKIGIKYKFKREKTVKNIKYIEDLLYPLIQDCISGKKRPTELVSNLIAQYQAGNIDLKQIRDDLATFLFAGFDTTAAGLTFMLHTISKNKSIQDKIAAESNEFFEQHKNNSYTVADVSNLKYNRMVAFETLRLYPPAWSFYRFAIEEDSILGYNIPAKSYIMISPYTIHRNGKYWKNPDEFIPERFEDEEINPTSSFKYIPFGAGRHICIGRRLAQFEMQLISALITSKYHLTSALDKDPVLVPSIILKSKNPVLIKMVKKEGKNA